MKVEQAIEMLQKYHGMQDEIMISWYGSNYRETDAKIWEKACELFDYEALGALGDTVDECITSAEIFFENEKEKAERGIDSYLETEKEKELEGWR